MCAFELARYIEIAMQPHFEKHGEEVYAEIMGDVLDFDAWLEPQKTRLSNCFVKRGGIDVPHSFVFKRYVDLSSAERSAAKDADADGDVYCITKRWMHSERPNGPPQLVLPVERSRQPGAHPISTRPGGTLSAARHAHILALARELESLTGDWDPEFSYYRGAKALKDFASRDVPVVNCHAWLFEVCVVDRAPGGTTCNRFFNTMPEMAWRMHVHFRELGGGGGV